MRAWNSQKILAFLALAAVTGAAGQDGSPRKNSSLPEGDGKQQLQTLCAGCHALGAVVAARRTRLGWERSVGEMVARGAKGSNDELESVVAYLTLTPYAKLVATAGFLYLPLWAMRRRNEDFSDYGVSLRTWKKDLKLFGILFGLILPLFTIGYLHQGDELVDSHSVREAVLGGRADHEWAADSTTRASRELQALIA